MNILEQKEFLLNDLKEQWKDITKNYDGAFEELELNEGTLWELNKKGSFKTGVRIHRGHGRIFYI